MRPRLGFTPITGYLANRAMGSGKNMDAKSRMKRGCHVVRGGQFFSDCGGEVFSPAKKEQGEAGIEF